MARKKQDTQVVAEQTQTVTPEQQAVITKGPVDTAAVTPTAPVPAPAALPTNTIVLMQDPDCMLVTEDAIDTEHYDNPRGELDNDSVNEMWKSLSQKGQLQNIVVAPALSTGKLPTAAGWTRTEAIRRMIFEPITEKFNAENNLKSTDPGFLSFSNPKHREIAAKVYPEETAKRREKFKIGVRVDKTIKTAADAFVTSVTENGVRTDPPLYSEIQAAENMIAKHGVTAKNAAIALQVSAAAVSQSRTMLRFIKDLESILITPDEGEQINESDLVKITESAKVLIDELMRRMKLKPKETHALPFGHVRQLAYASLADDKDVKQRRKLTRAQIMRGVCQLVGADEQSFKLPQKNVSHPNYGIFDTGLNNMMAETKKRREIADNPAAAPVATAADPTAVTGAESGTPASDVAGGTVAGLAAAQAATPVSGQAEAAALNATVAVTPAPGTTPVSTGNVTPAGATTQASSIAAALEMTPEEVAALDPDAETADGADPNTPAGLKKAKVQAAPTQTFKVKSPDGINKIAMESRQYALQEAEESQPLNSMMIIASAAGAATAYEVLGVDEKFLVWKQAITDHTEDMEQYIEELEQYAKMMHSKFGGPKAPRELIRPKFKVTGEELEPVFAQAEDTTLADMDVDLDSSTGPSDEALAEIENGLEGESAEDLESIEAIMGTEE